MRVRKVRFVSVRKVTVELDLHKGNVAAEY